MMNFRYCVGLAHYSVIGNIVSFHLSTMANAEEMQTFTL